LRKRYHSQVQGSSGRVKMKRLIDEMRRSNLFAQ
jgi:hypothetical protein